MKDLVFHDADPVVPDPLPEKDRKADYSAFKPKAHNEILAMCFTTNYGENAIFKRFNRPPRSKAPARTLLFQSTIAKKILLRTSKRAERGDLYLGEQEEEAQLHGLPDIRKV